MTVQNTQHEFIMSFFTILFPPLVGTLEDNQSAAERLDSEGVDAMCVARLSIAPGRLPHIIEALQENLSRWQSREGSIPDGAEDD